MIVVGEKGKMVFNAYPLDGLELW